MKGFIGDIEKETLENTNFRKVLYTAKHSQLVLMCLKPGEEIGLETHEDHDQFFRIDRGQGAVEIDEVRTEIEDGFAVVVPAGAKHNIINTSTNSDLKLYTIYSPAEHRDGVIHATKADAESGEEHFDGKTTE